MSAGLREQTAGGELGQFGGEIFILRLLRAPGGVGGGRGVIPAIESYRDLPLLIAVDGLEQGVGLGSHLDAGVIAAGEIPVRVSEKESRQASRQAISLVCSS